jgi:predicted lactoylglutathione lyase
MAVCNIIGFGTHIKVKDIEKSRKFYEALGFKSVFAYGDEELGLLLIILPRLSVTGA